MKAFTITTFILLFVVSCSYERDYIYPIEGSDDIIVAKGADSCSFVNVEKSNEDPSYYFVNNETAASFVNLQYPERKVIHSETISDGGSSLYLFDFEDGWAIVASDKRMQPLLAISNEGYIDSKTLVNGPMAGWYNLVSEELKALKDYNPNIDNEYVRFWNSFGSNTFFYDNGDSESMSTKGEPGEPHFVWGKLLMSSYLWSDFTLIDIGHLLETKWGQASPWNVSMPVISSTNIHLLTGCVAVALSQIIYYEHFEQGHPSFLYHDPSIISYFCTPISDSQGVVTVDVNRGILADSSTRWSQMAVDSTCIGDANRFKYVSDLMLDIGNLVDMHYSYSNNYPDISYAFDDDSLTNFRNVLYDYGFDANYSAYSFNTVYTEISNRRPVFIANNGHAWIIDGYVKRNLCYKLTYYWSKIYDSSLWENCSVIDEDPDSIHHEGDEEYEYLYTSLRFLKMNWGYDGQDNDVLVSLQSSGSWNVGNYSSVNTKLITSINPSQL